MIGPKVSFIQRCHCNACGGKNYIMDLDALFLEGVQFQEALGFPQQHRALNARGLLHPATTE